MQVSVNLRYLHSLSQCRIGRNLVSEFVFVFFSYSCASLQQVQVHRNRAHDHKNYVRRCIDETCICYCCMVNHNNREALLNHLRYRSEICLTSLILKGPIVIDEEAAALEEADRPRK